MENLQYHDLIQSDFTDSYNNLTIKTMVIMDWLATRCPLLSPSCPLEVETLVSPTCPLEEETLVSPPQVHLKKSIFIVFDKELESTLNYYFKYSQYFF